MDPEAAKSRDEREIMLLGPRQAESCRSHVQDYLQGSRSVHGEAFTAAIFDACVNFVRACVHPSSLAAQSPPCTRPPNALPDTQQRRQPQASSVEGYHNASAASTASINCRSHVQDYLHGSRSTSRELLQPCAGLPPWLTLSARSSFHGCDPRRMRSFRVLHRHFSGLHPLFVATSSAKFSRAVMA